jgi:hypothetical protein
MTSDTPTCGKGLAEHAALPRKLADLVDTLADNLQLHVGTLDLRDDKAIAERDVYVALVAGYRTVAKELAAMAGTMANARTLPMATHDMAAMNSPAIRAAFERYVRVEGELAAQVHADLDRDRAMLTQLGKV